MLDELGVDGFDEQEEINIGLQRKGHLIELHSKVWKPQVELWAQVLRSVSQIQPCLCLHPRRSTDT